MKTHSEIVAACGMSMDLLLQFSECKGGIIILFREIDGDSITAAGARTEEDISKLRILEEQIQITLGYSNTFLSRTTIKKDNNGQTF